MPTSAQTVAASLAAAFVFASHQAAVAAPVISEIMYRPGTTFPENTALEYIELHNPGATAVNVGGWEFRSGVSFTFPAGTNIAAGGYVVVAANPSAVNAAYGSTGTLGPWTAGAALSNNGEKITLSMPGAAPGTWTKVDEVSYSSEGDWALRYREPVWGGWDWTTPASGGGKSVELRNPALSNDNGQNWASSTAAAGGTPGSANTANTANLPPVIHSVKHSPVVPRSTESVTISCEVNDEAVAASRTATLFYRNATASNPGVFLSAVMTGDGTGKFTAVLPPAADKSLWEFYISSNDGVATRTWPAATTEGQNANCVYQVDNEVPSSTADTYRITMTKAENNAFEAVSKSSDRQFNQTLIVTRGTETTIRYRGTMRIRGNSSRDYQFKPLRIGLPADEAWDGVTGFNLHPRAPHLQHLGMRLFQAAGLASSDTIPVELRRNGVEYTTSSGSTPDFGRWARVEPEGSDYVQNHWPAADGGNIYTKRSPERYWRSAGWTVPANPDGLLDNWAKQNNKAPNDWSDLTGFFTIAQTTAAPHFPGASPTDVSNSNGGRLSGTGDWNNTALDGDELEFLQTVADTAQWARFFAVMTILQDYETNISNGVDDDYGVYFIPGVDGRRRAQFVPHDLDTIFGMGDSSQNYNASGLFDMTEGGQSGYAFRTLLPLLGTGNVPGNAEFRNQYFTALRELCGSVCSDSTFSAFVDRELSDWAPANIRTEIKTFNSQRCAYLLGLIGQPAIPPTAATSNKSLTSTHGALIISEILAANATSHSNGGLYPDVIEIQNTGASTIDLGGKSLTDDPAQPQKFVFTAGTLLTAGARMVLYADSSDSAPGLHTGFSLDQSGDALYLYENPANGGAVIDSVSFGPQATDYSIGRTGAGLTTWNLGSPTIGAVNNTVAVTGDPSALRINEWLGNPDFRLDDDFLEIHNSTALPVPMGGMTLTDDFRSYPAQHILPALSFIGPGGFHLFKAKGSSASATSPSDLPFSINSTFGWLALIGTNGAIADRVDIVSQWRDEPTGRSPDSGTAVAEFTIPSPGLPNGAPPAAYQALLNSLRISEFNYKPTGGSDFEFVELMNIGTSTLDLSGVRFTGGIDYTFPPGVSIGPGAFIIVCQNQAALIGRFPAVGPVLAPGEFTGALDNNGETIVLSLPNPWDVAILNFRYETTWEPLTFSSGYSLKTVNATVSAPRDWSERKTWTVSTGPNGIPGSDIPPGINSPLTASGITGDPFSYQITATGAPSIFNAQGLPTGLTVNTVNGLVGGTPTQSGVFNVSISATNTAGADTETLSLTISTSGPLHRFVWDHTTSSAQAGVPFPAWITARDLQGRTVTAYNGTVPVTGTATAGGVDTSTVVITEVTDENEDQFELQNTGSTPVNTSGWFVVIGNSIALDAVNSVTWPLPASVAPGAILRVSELNTAGRLYFGGTISWTPASNRGWIMVLDSTSTIKDFMAWGWTAAQLATFSIPPVNGNTITLTGEWTGDGAAVGNRAPSNNSWQRIGAKDNSTAADWLFAANASSWSVTNPGLTIPWNSGSQVTVAPSSVTFSSGVFTGFLTIPSPATGVRLTSADTQSHTGQSALFDVLTAPTDTDADKMPDAWETANGLNPAVNDAAGDLDKDGWTNRNEYYAGTDPRSAASSLRITSWGTTPTAQVSLSWNATANRLYKVGYAPNLAGWSYVPGQIYAPVSNGTQTATFAPPAGAMGHNFFRVELLTPP